MSSDSSPAPANSPNVVEAEDAIAQLQALLLEPKLSELNQQNATVALRLKALESAVLEPDHLQQWLYPAMLAGLKHQITHQPEALAEALTGVVGKAIEKELATQQAQLCQELAPAVVRALAHQSQTVPESVGQAIGPELAIAIREQIVRKRGAIAKELAPELSLALKAQIREEREAIIDALYPVIGNIIARYLAETIKEINAKVEQTLSPEGVKRKLRARIKGVSEAELLLSESMPSQLQAIFLIHKTSGLVMAEVQQSPQALDADMVAGMLTAIRSFVSEYIAIDDFGQDLHEIEYGDSRVVLEVTGYCYLALIVRGQLPSPLLSQTRQVMQQLISDYGDDLKQYNGDPRRLPPEIYPLLTSLVTQSLEPTISSSSKPARSRGRWIGLVAGVLVLLTPLFFWQYRLHQQQQLVNTLNQALQTQPSLALYRVSARRQRKGIKLQGIVPTPKLIETAEDLATAIAPQQIIDNQMIVWAPPFPTSSATQRNWQSWLKPYSHAPGSGG